MKALPMKSNGHAQDCNCIICQAQESTMVFGQWKTFRDFCDGICDTFKPKQAYIYPKFAVLEFEWATDRKKVISYLEDRSADRYTGVHFDDDGEYDVVLIDVTGEAPTDD